MKLGIIADVHSNAPALAAVMEELAAYHPDLIVQLGDAANGPIDPSGAMQILRKDGMLHIRGNGDRMVVSGQDATPSGSARFARSLLSAEEIEWMRTWPELHQDSRFVACHGSPTGDTDYLLESVDSTGVSLRSPEDIRSRIRPIKSSLILCGHTHLPRVVQIDEQTLVVNPGSVGLPAYSDKTPVLHRMETGSPHARYATAEYHRGQWKVSLISIPYDWESAARKAELNGFPGWAFSLRTGYAR